MGTGSENAVVMVVNHLLKTGAEVGLRRSAGRQMKQVPGTLGNSEFLRRLVLMLVFLNFQRIADYFQEEKSLEVSAFP